MDILYFCSKSLILIFVLFILVLSSFNWLRIAESKIGMTDSGLPVLITISAIFYLSPPLFSTPSLSLSQSFLPLYLVNKKELGILMIFPILNLPSLALFKLDNMVDFQIKIGHLDLSHLSNYA